MFHHYRAGWAPGTGFWVGFVFFSLRVYWAFFLAGLVFRFVGPFVFNSA
jgi:hypothetical protein